MPASSIPGAWDGPCDDTAHDGVAGVCVGKFSGEHDAGGAGHAHAHVARAGTDWGMWGWFVSWEGTCDEGACRACGVPSTLFAVCLHPGKIANPHARAATRHSPLP